MNVQDRSIPAKGFLKGVDLKACTDAGMSIQDIAEEYDVGYETVRRSLNRYGLKAVGELQKSYRELALAMRPMDAVDYLLGVIDEISSISSSSHHEIDEIGVHFTRLERRLLLALYEHSPNLLSHRSIGKAMYFDSPDGDYPGDKIVQIYVCKIRKKLPKSWGEICLEWGHGYRLVLNETGDAR